MKWMERIHGGDVYKDFPLHEWTSEIDGWGSDSPVFEDVIGQIKPQTIVEVGTWKGASAINMSRLLQKNDIDGEIICVDHWLADATINIPRKWGLPQMYYQFLANVLYAKQSSTIVPLPSESILAAGLLKKWDMQADVIYIDAGHDYFHAINDMRAHWNVLRPGGVMFGHDYNAAWPGVVRAIAEFSDQVGVPFTVPSPDFWLVQKHWK